MSSGTGAMALDEGETGQASPLNFGVTGAGQATTHASFGAEWAEDQSRKVFHEQRAHCAYSTELGFGVVRIVTRARHSGHLSPFR